MIDNLLSIQGTFVSFSDNVQGAFTSRLFFLSDGRRVRVVLETVDFVYLDAISSFQATTTSSTGLVARRNGDAWNFEGSNVSIALINGI